MASIILIPSLYKVLNNEITWATVLGVLLGFLGIGIGIAQIISFFKIIKKQ